MKKEQTNKEIIKGGHDLFSDEMRDDVENFDGQKTP